MSFNLWGLRRVGNHYRPFIIVGIGSDYWWQRVV